jgi:hypothetical protein
MEQTENERGAVRRAMHRLNLAPERKAAGALLPSRKCREGQDLALPPSVRHRKGCWRSRRAGAEIPRRDPRKEAERKARQSEAKEEEAMKEAVGRWLAKGRQVKGQRENLEQRHHPPRKEYLPPALWAVR